MVQKHHVGRLGHYVEMAAERGMIGLALAAGQGVANPAAVPYGGAEKLLHTNPLAVAFPTGVADHPLMFDFATSATAGVKVTNAERRGQKLEHGYIVDRHGSPTDDPREFFAGGGHAPFGGHKGYAIMLMGGVPGPDLRRRRHLRRPEPRRDRAPRGCHDDRHQGRPVSAPGPVRDAFGRVRRAHPCGAAGARVRRGAGPRRPGGAHPRSPPPRRHPDRGRRMADGRGGRSAGRPDGRLMDIRTAVRPISQVKSNAAALIRQINETRQPIVITQNGEAKAVLVDPRSYQEMVDGLAILKLISQSERSIELDDVETHVEVVGELRHRLNTP